MGIDDGRLPDSCDNVYENLNQILREPGYRLTLTDF